MCSGSNSFGFVLVTFSAKPVRPYQPMARTWLYVIPATRYLIAQCFRLPLLNCLWLCVSGISLWSFCVWVCPSGFSSSFPFSSPSSFSSSLCSFSSFSSSVSSSVLLPSFASSYYYYFSASPLVLLLLLRLFSSV